MSYTLGSLFAGIGGIDLGFERVGFTTSWQVEIDPYCQKVLNKNFPHAARYFDVRQVCGIAGCRGSCGRSSHVCPVDVISGGFPCQDISNAGLRAGIDGERSGLWREMHRIVGELRPRVVFVENVAALLGRGISRVLGDLSEIGYDAEWEIVSAADVGAPHLRERVWIVAYPHSHGCHFGRLLEARAEGQAFGSAIASGEHWSDSSRSEAMANAYSRHIYRRSSSLQMGRIWRQGEAENDGLASRAQWSIEPDVGRVAHGVPNRVDRLRALGNAVVPQIPEMFAREIRKALDAQKVTA